MRGYRSKVAHHVPARPDRSYLPDSRQGCFFLPPRDVLVQGFFQAPGGGGAPRWRLPGCRFLILHGGLGLRGFYPFPPPAHKLDALADPGRSSWPEIATVRPSRARNQPGACPAAFPTSRRRRRARGHTLSKNALGRSRRWRDIGATRRWAGRDRIDHGGWRPGHGAGWSRWIVEARFPSSGAKGPRVSSKFFTPTCPDRRHHREVRAKGPAARLQGAADSTARGL